MTEEAWTTARIGGAAAKNIIAELMQLTHEFGDCQGPTLETDGALTIAGMVNYANPEDLKSFCQTHRSTYRIHNAACPGVFDPEIDYWRPDKGTTTWDCNQGCSTLSTECHCEH